MFPLMLDRVDMCGTEAEIYGIVGSEDVWSFKIKIEVA